MLLWLLLDESGKGQKQLFLLEREGAEVGLWLGVEAGRSLRSRQQSPASTSRRGECARLVAAAGDQESQLLCPVGLRLGFRGRAGSVARA